MCSFHRCRRPPAWSFGDRPVCDYHLRVLDQLGPSEARRVLNAGSSSLKPLGWGGAWKRIREAMRGSEQ